MVMLIVNIQLIVNILINTTYNEIKELKDKLNNNVKNEELYEDMNQMLN